MMNDTSICTGSHLNARTFPEDDYWASFQSTIYSGQVYSVEELAAERNSNADETVTLACSRHASDATTSVADLSSLLEDEAARDDDPLNLNIDALSSPGLDSSDFYDCPSFEKSPANLVRPTASRRIFNVVYSPRPYSQPQLYAVQFTSPPETNDGNNGSSGNKSLAKDILASPRKQRPASARRISPTFVITHASNNNNSNNNQSSSSNAEMRTGSYLVQMIDEFNRECEEHAQSTPKLASLDSGNPSSAGSFSVAVSPPRSGVDQVRKTLDFQNAETVVLSPQPPKQQQEDVSVSNKENFYDGRYSRFVTLRRAMEKKPSPPPPKKVPPTRPGKVALLKDYFQTRVNDSIALHRSRIPLPIRGGRVKKSPQAKTRALGSPSYQCRKSYKLLASRSSNSSSSSSHHHHPSTATSFASSGSESFLTRNQRKSARTTRVQSCSDAIEDAAVASSAMDETCKSQSTGDLPSAAAAESTTSIKALHSSKITRRAYFKEADKPATQLQPSPRKVSAINKRRSVGMQLKKNASPVRPVCEIRKLFTPSKRAGISAGAQCSFNVTRKQASHLVVPKIVISHL